MTAEHTDWKSDLAELFRERQRTHGALYATRRLVVDILSLVVRRPRAGGVVQDVRHALRLFRKHAGTVSVTIVGLSLAIAMCTTVFSILNAAARQAFVMDDPSTVVKVQRLYERGVSTSWPYSAFVELQRGATLASVQASLGDGVRLESSPGAPALKPESILFVSGGYLPMLGGGAAIGRTLDPSDDRPGATPVVVISHAFWRHHFNGDATIVGRTIKLSGGTATVAGVLRPKFSGPFEKPPSFWAPFSTYGVLYGGATIRPTSQIQVTVIARPVGAESAAQDQLSGVANGLLAVGLDSSDVALRKTTGVQFSQAAPDAGQFYLVIAITFVTLGLVLALACANVANLMLAGAASRAREFGVRVAMGASRQRLVRQVLTESVVIGSAAGVLGFVLAVWMVPLLARIVGLPLSYDVTPDLTVMLFTTVTALVSGVGAGLAPARYGARSDVSGILKSQSLQAGSSLKASRLRRGFIAFQAAASMLLLVTAALFLRAALHITKIDLGFDADKLVTVSLAYPRSSADSAADHDHITAYLRNAIERVSALPAIERVSLALYPPFGGTVAITNLNHNGAEYTLFDNRTDASYFATAGLRIVRGRAYTADEVADRAQVAVVSESLVHDFLPGIEPIGASLKLVSNGSAGVTIIGVAAEALVSSVRGGGGGTTYRPIEPETLGAARLVIRTPDPDRVIRDVEAALVAIDSQVRPRSSAMHEDVGKFMNESRIVAGLSGAVALIALVLSVLGIFGVTSFVVGQRTQEVSVRMAIGASAGDVVRLLIRQNMWPVVGGLAIGLAVALLGTRVLTAALSGISPHDPLAIIPAVALLAGTALAAIAVPAMRAARTDPASVLRQ